MTRGHNWRCEQGSNLRGKFPLDNLSNEVKYECKKSSVVIDREENKDFPGTPIPIEISVSAVETMPDNKEVFSTMPS